MYSMFVWQNDSYNSANPYKYEVSVFETFSNFVKAPCW